jgi:hypothetical protein
MKRGHTEKTKLTPEEKLRVAHAYLILGVSQHALVSLFTVNQGRINDAISDVRRALKWEPEPIEVEDEEQGDGTAD